MRWYILKALLVKEWQRHVTNRGGIALALLLIAAAVLLSVFGPGGDTLAGATAPVGGVRFCFIEYDQRSPLVDHLEAHPPPAPLRDQVILRPLARADRIDDLIVYPTGTAAIQLRHLPAERSPSGRPTLLVAIWHPEGDPRALAPYETWLWREIRRGYASQARRHGVHLPPEPEFDPDNHWVLIEAHRRLQEQVAAGLATEAPLEIPDLMIDRRGLGGSVLDLRSTIATGLIIFALYFTCVYLLPTMTCEERERGVLLAQALSPASPGEIVAAKFLFYPGLGVALAAILAAIHQTAILSRLFFWLAVVSVGGGFLGIGMTIATLARTQRAAFLGGMCYLLSVSMVLLICSVNRIPFLPWLAVEYHGPRILHAAVTGEVLWYHWYNLGGAFALAVVWLVVAGQLFRLRGWQ